MEAVAARQSMIWGSFEGVVGKIWYEMWFSCILELQNASNVDNFYSGVMEKFISQFLVGRPLQLSLNVARGYHNDCFTRLVCNDQGFSLSRLSDQGWMVAMLGEAGVVDGTHFTNVPL